tara:strand:+ start:1076 stop:1756 length:681 start_codon:yes stop_codon:yes gene_type:complete
MKILGFIPARKGSKRIKNKNLINFGGKPLIYYTINLCKKLRFVTPFVSTNSKKISIFAKKNGIKFNYLRPENLSNDKSKIIESVFDALNWFEGKKIYFDAVMLLQPTNPIRKLQEVDEIIKIFLNKKVSSIASVTKMKEHPFECVKIKKNNKWRYLVENKLKKKRAQDYPKDYYFIDGSVFLADVKFLRKNKDFITKNKTYLYKSSQFPGIDIDEAADLKIAKTFL